MWVKRALAAGLLLYMQALVATNGSDVADARAAAEHRRRSPPARPARRRERPASRRDDRACTGRHSGTISISPTC